MKFHSQNLNEKYYGEKEILGSMLEHGRCWLRFEEGASLDKSVRLEWELGPRARFCHAKLYFSEKDGYEVTFALGLPFLFSYFLTFENFFKPSDRKYVPMDKRGNWNIWGTKTGISLYLEDMSLSFFLLNDDDMWSSVDPFWSRFRRTVRLNLPDIFFGKDKFSKENLKVEEVEIPLPEGLVKAKVEITLHKHERPRWFTKHYVIASVTPEKGVETNHKGPLFGMSVGAKSSAEAVGKFIAAVLRDRGGPKYWKIESREVA